MSNSSIWRIEKPYQVQPLRAIVKLRAMAMNGYLVFFKAKWLEPCHQMVLCPIGDIFLRGWDAVGVFYSPIKTGTQKVYELSVSD